MAPLDPRPALFLADWEGRRLHPGSAPLALEPAVDRHGRRRARHDPSRGRAFPGVAWPVLGGVAVFGCLYNFLLQRSQKEGDSPSGRRAALLQAVVDLGMLTAVLWSAGGIESPFLGYYVFHVALIAILGGPRAAFVAATAALVGAGMLSLSVFYPQLGVAGWNPTPPGTPSPTSSRS